MQLSSKYDFRVVIYYIEIGQVDLTKAKYEKWLL